MPNCKVFYNSLERAVPDNLEGLCAAFPRLICHTPKRVVLAPDYKEKNGKVSIICGGGSGHEPFAAGLVGSGMLTAAVAGNIFASPPSQHILHAIKCVAEREGGVLVISPNYTGDSLNFGIAIEKAKQSGIKALEHVPVGDDCSIPKDEQGRAGRRGLVGIVLVIKVAGALSEQLKPLSEVYEIAQLVANNIATSAVAFTACILPGSGLMFELADDDIEFGQGIHGEAGYKRMKWVKSSEAVSLMLDAIDKTLPLRKGDNVVVVVNNFGACSLLEQSIVVNDAVKQLKSQGVNPVRVYAGHLMTSLNSAGLHICVLKLPKKEEALILKCLDQSTDAPGWTGNAYSVPSDKPKEQYHQAEDQAPLENVGKSFTNEEENLFKACITSACQSLIEKESHINELDKGCGDADCGSTLKELATGILQSLHQLLPTKYPSTVLNVFSNIAEERMGGTTGALYSLMFMCAANEIAKDENSKQNWPAVWCRACSMGLTGMMRYSQAQLGDRTMFDALEPACRAFTENVSLLLNKTSDTSSFCSNVTEAVWKGCNSTKDMQAMAGRASYVKQTQYLKNEDAGAFGIATWISAVLNTLSK